MKFSDALSKYLSSSYSSRFGTETSTRDSAAQHDDRDLTGTPSVTSQAASSRTISHLPSKISRDGAIGTSRSLVDPWNLEGDDWAKYFNVRGYINSSIPFHPVIDIDPRSPFFQAFKAVLQLNKQWTLNVLSLLDQADREEGIMARIAWDPNDERNRARIETDSFAGSVFTISSANQILLTSLKPGEPQLGQLTRTGRAGVTVHFVRLSEANQDVTGSEEHLYFRMYPPHFSFP